MDTNFIIMTSLGSVRNVTSKINRYIRELIVSQFLCFLCNNKRFNPRGVY